MNEIPGVPYDHSTYLLNPTQLAKGESVVDAAPTKEVAEKALEIARQLAGDNDVTFSIREINIFPIDPEIAEEHGIMSAIQQPIPAFGVIASKNSHRT